MERIVEKGMNTTVNVPTVAGEMALQMVAYGLQRGELDVRQVGLEIHRTALEVASRSRLPDVLDGAQRIESGVIAEIVKRMEGTK